MVNVVTTGSKILMARTKYGMSQEELAAEAHTYQMAP